MKKLKLKVPASTANLGVGFDSIGMALDKYLEVEAYLSEDGKWHFEHVGPHLKGLPDNEEHYITKIAQTATEKFSKEMPALNLKMYSDIPLARGLGSSASALVTGLFLANYFANLKLSKYELLQLATEIEGHPDNVAPTIYGGLVLGVYDPEAKHTDVSYIDIPKVDVIATIPEYELSTEKARKVLPETLSLKDAVKYSAISNTMISALIQHNYELAGKMMMKDGFHEPYRQHLIPDFERIKALAIEHGAYATVISGAGPTVLTLVKKELSGKLVRALQVEFEDCESELVTINRYGISQKIINL
ncbi:homoserine kinase [Mammaliicoccus sciuri]|uniref:homoserine kinase n=1 Tax=Mammaliicoccus sciuri TaxID=1296 RepID=UPI00066E3DC7|nr:homoserine kinase [Mammaliicoccus sciuri]MCD3220171.1 homoserine kinase [Mammaliicoccus sciuri]MCJ0908949.1 homoserine kinase [Mammaliicoccus sciuri]MCJ0921143.1 homoserine kinase [Mammaliicoccus sciuri]MCJ1762314.1 homoserine kinase [Mammaliicoccus sciuri]MDO0952218.1 homoserine kinase [Mammaliicoccus sciuri]